MGTTELVKMTCTIARSVDAIGLSLDHHDPKGALDGSAAGDDIQMHTGISPHLLSVRMKKLEKAGTETEDPRPRLEPFRF